jgi:hypothetical protein
MRVRTVLELFHREFSFLSQDHTTADFKYDNYSLGIEQPEIELRLSLS